MIETRRVLFFQNDRYTIGGTEMFDTLTDLVEHYKRKGIEEMSGNWVHFKQVTTFFVFFTKILYQNGFMLSGDALVQ